MQETPDSSEGGHIYRPAVRLPPFWPDRPGLCLAQAEAQFALATVTSERTKFNYVISQLEYRPACYRKSRTFPAKWQPYPVAIFDIVLAPETNARIIENLPRPSAQQFAVTADTTVDSETRQASVRHPCSFRHQENGSDRG